MHIETVAVRAGADIDLPTGAVTPPIHLSTTFEHGPAGEEIHGYSYIRENNPTQSRLEETLRQLEGGEVAAVFSSGMGAGAAVLQSLGSDSHVILPRDMYADLKGLCDHYLPKWGIQATTVDMHEIDQVRAALRPTTRLIWIETPSNPLLTITDIRAVSEIAHATGARVLVDNTLATPILQRPLELGADIALHATTKYCGGHNDAQGGALIVKQRDALSDELLRARKLLGAVASPFGCWLILRGIRSLPCRMERHSANAAIVAEALASSDKVGSVYYPGLASHRGHREAAQQMKGFGGVLSFTPRRGYKEALRVASRVRLFINATSLGGTQSLIEHRASIEGKGSNVPDNLLRLAIGLEHPDDLVEDLLQALS